VHRSTCPTRGLDGGVYRRPRSSLWQAVFPRPVLTNPEHFHSKINDNILRAPTEKGKDNDGPQETASDPRFGK
jgi:hypothetical protein